MSNHFHLLIRVPDKAAATKLTAESLRKVLPEIYSNDVLLAAEQELDRAVEGGEEALAELLICSIRIGTRIGTNFREFSRITR